MNHNWSESSVIQEITRIFENRNDVVERGIGDDCAVMHDGMKLITTDASIEGVHFDLRWMSFADAAYRCMTSNVSDIAAMGAYAGPFTLALGLRPELTFDEISSAIQAIKDCIRDHHLDKCWLIGGDVVRCPNAMFSITMLAPVTQWPAVYRNGAAPGDAILALGRLGHAGAGLDLFLAETAPDIIQNNDLNPLLDAFKRPLAQTTLGPLLAKEQLVSAMMDLSDGIRTDLPRLLAQSHCGAQIELAQLSPDDLLCRAAALLHKDPIDMMICGGEDFGLLVTAPQHHVPRIHELAMQCHVPCTQLGICTKDESLHWLENQQPSQRADLSFSHF